MRLLAARPYSAAGLVLCLASALAYGQDAQPETPVRKQSIGFRVRGFPVGSMSVLGDSSAMTTTASPVYDWRFQTTSRGFPLSAGPALEFAIGRRATLTAELLFHRLRYDKVTTIYSGGDDPNTGNDERSVTTRTENTKARLWDIPVMLHYNVAARGPWSRFYVAGGAAYRTVSKVRTTNDVTYSNAETATDYNAVAPNRRGMVGAVAGIGFRFIDDFNIKSTPEIRYTRWLGRAFDLDTTRTPVNQLEIGIGFTF